MTWISPTTPDRTTIRIAIEQFTTMLGNNLVADPPTSTAPFRSLLVGPGDAEHLPRPLLAVRLLNAEPVGDVDEDKLMQVEMAMSLMVDAIHADPHGPLLDAIGAVDDYLDALLEAGVVEGADGFDRRTWSFAYPTRQAGARVIRAEAKHAAIVRVAGGKTASRRNGREWA